MKSNKILIVENNLKYIDVAKAFYDSKNVGVDFITNYADAKKALPGYEKAMIDIFIPENGIERIGKEGKKLNEYFMNSLKEKKDNFLIDYLENENKPAYNAIMRYAKFVAGMNLKELNKKTLDKLTSQHGLDLRMLDSSIKSSGMYNELEREIAKLSEEEAKGHAPLGIKLAEQADNLKIPFVFVTDGDHHHGPLYNAVCGVFFEKKYPRIVDNKSGEKSSTGFWEIALQYLK